MVHKKENHFDVCFSAPEKFKFTSKVSCNAMAPRQVGVTRRKIIFTWGKSAYITQVSNMAPGPFA
jgi:hypothetical protein